LQHCLLCWWTEGKCVPGHPPQLQTTWVTLWKGYLGSEKWLRPYTEPTNSKLCANKLQTYKSVDIIMDPSQAVLYPVEFLNSLEPSCIPPHNLELKIGVPIMLLRNLGPPPFVQRH
jgi:hypothetical protein